MVKNSSDVECFGFKIPLIITTDHFKTDQNGCHLEFLGTGLVFKWSVEYRHEHDDRPMKNRAFQNLTFKTL